MGGHAASAFSLGSAISAIINPAAGAVKVGTELAGGSSTLGNTAATATNPLAGATGALVDTVTARMPKPEVPGAIPQTPQAQAAVDQVGGRNMTLAQQMAMTAGGTLFGTPRQAWGAPISNQGGGRSLLGA